MASIRASDTEATDAEVGYGTIGYNQYGCGRASGKIVVNGLAWDKSLGAHADSRIVYEVPPGISTFQAMYALEDHNAGAVVFACRANDDLTFTSHRMSKSSGQPLRPFLLQVPVRPQDRIVLIADSYFNMDHDPSCWLQPAFVGGDGTGP